MMETHASCGHLRAATSMRLSSSLVMKHQAAITGLFFRFARETDNLEDVVQETFVRACRGLGGRKPERPFVHWLKRIAVRVGLEFCRKQPARRSRRRKKTRSRMTSPAWRKARPSWIRRSCSNYPPTSRESGDFFESFLSWHGSLRFPSHGALRRFSSTHKRPADCSAGRLWLLRPTTRGRVASGKKQRSSAD